MGPTSKLICPLYLSFAGGNFSGTNFETNLSLIIMGENTNGTHTESNLSVTTT